MQAPFKSEAPLLLEVFHLIFDGISASELLTAGAVDQTSGSHSKTPRVCAVILYSICSQRIHTYATYRLLRSHVIRSVNMNSEVGMTLSIGLAASGTVQVQQWSKRQDEPPMIGFLECIFQLIPSIGCRVRAAAGPALQPLCRRTTVKSASWHRPV